MDFSEYQCVNFDDGAEPEHPNTSSFFDPLPNALSSPRSTHNSSPSPIWSIRHGVSFAIGVLFLMFLLGMAITLAPQASNSYSTLVEHTIVASGEYVQGKIMRCRKFLIAKYSLGIRSNIRMNEGVENAWVASGEAKFVRRSCNRGKPLRIPRSMTCSQILAQWYKNSGLLYVQHNGGSPCGAKAKTIPKGSQLCIP